MTMDFARSIEKVAQLSGEVGPKVGPSSIIIENQTLTALDAKEVAQLTGWSDTKCKRFFRSNKEYLINTNAKGGPGGKKRLLPINFLPEEFQAKYRKLNGIIDPDL